MTPQELFHPMSREHAVYLLPSRTFGAHVLRRLFLVFRRGTQLGGLVLRGVALRLVIAYIAVARLLRAELTVPSGPGTWLLRETQDFVLG